MKSHREIYFNEISYFLTLKEVKPLKRSMKWFFLDYFKDFLIFMLVLAHYLSLQGGSYIAILFDFRFHSVYFTSYSTENPSKFNTNFIRKLNLKMLNNF